jgi:superfamily I DNA and/or RNA helicase
LRFATSPPPDSGKISIYPPCFLIPLKKVWEDSSRYSEISQYYDALVSSPKQIYSELFKDQIKEERLGWLRENQKEAFNLFLFNFGYLWGPPGTGKTTTLGVILSEYLLKFPQNKVLLISTTNVALDEALTSVDRSLEKLTQYNHKASVIRNNIKRIGTHFRAGYYDNRKHLLPASNEDLLEKLILLKSQEPHREDIQEYAKWKEEKEKLENLLKTRVRETLNSSMLCAITSTSATFHFDKLREFQPFDLIVFDEASQMGMAHALALTPLARQVIFAGDPKQLSPIVQSKNPDARKWMGESVFKYMEKGKDSTVTLTEQSRMFEPICKLVSNIFYDGRLIIAKDKLSDSEWLEERSFPQLPTLKSVSVVTVEQKGTWSQKYGGNIRWELANSIVEVVEALLNKGIDKSRIAILTPFRAQRRMIKYFMRNVPRVLVSTVHGVQGSERDIVIFDPVDGSSNFLQDDNGKSLINVAISRAKACLIIFLSNEDKSNAILNQISNMVDLSEAVEKPISYEEIVLQADFPENYFGKIVALPNCVGKIMPCKDDGKEPKIIVIDCKTGGERKYNVNSLRQKVQRTT